MSNQRSTGSPVSELIQFRHSAGMPCPYLPGRVERQLFTELSDSEATDDIFHQLSGAGFRRSHHIVYRPACAGCSACVPVRVVTREFMPGRNWRRVLRANDDLVARDAGLTVTDEQYGLFRRYILSRHGDGDMAMMTRRDYAAMVLASPVDTRIFEFRGADGALVAACLTDVMPDGFSAVYSVFEPTLSARSLGSFMVLWLIGEALRVGLPYVYLGFRVEGSRKMEYKNRFRPLESFGPGGWTRLATAADR